MFVIRNKLLRKLVTDKDRIPLTFDTIESACDWLNSKITGLDNAKGLNRNYEMIVGDYVIVNVFGLGFSKEERKQLLKINIQ